MWHDTVPCDQMPQSHVTNAAVSMSRILAAPKAAQQLSTAMHCMRASLATMPLLQDIPGYSIVISAAAHYQHHQAVPL
jgi:hypothetical protein